LPEWAQGMLATITASLHTNEYKWNCSVAEI